MPSGTSAGAEFLRRQRESRESRELPYVPTKSTNPPRPRTLEASYVPDSQTLNVVFRDGTPWSYYNVPKNVWRNFRRSPSPGRFIARVLDNYSHGPRDF